MQLPKERKKNKTDMNGRTKQEIESEPLFFLCVAFSVSFVSVSPLSLSLLL